MIRAALFDALVPAAFPAESIFRTQGKVGFYSGIGYPNWGAWPACSVEGILLAVILGMAAAMIVDTLTDKGKA